MNAESFFRNFWEHIYAQRPRNSVELNQNAFSAYLEVDINPDNIEMPTVMLPYFRQVTENGCRRIVCNLSSGCGRHGEDSFRHKTSSAILSRFVDASGYNDMRMAKVITMKNVCYYGTKGLILDENFSPLVMGTLCMSSVENNEGRRFHLHSPKFLVSYKVFENASGLLESLILKQVIPMFHTREVPVAGISHYDWHNEFVDVIVDDFDYMVKRPELLSMDKLSQESFNKVIYDNI